MSTIVYQGFQSSSESHIIETTTLKLRLPTPTPTEFGRPPCIENNMENLNEKYQDTKKSSSNKNADIAGWSSLQNLPTINPKLDSKEKEHSYVHPLSKQLSSSRLSEKSLALCTENLGCETGITDHIIESSIFSFSSDVSNTVQSQSSTTKTDIRVDQYTPSSATNYKVITNTEISCRKLPPPLTTLRGSNSLQVSTHREGGRLIIKAVEAPKVRTYLHAERSNGRLRLCFLKEYGNSASKFDLLETADDENEESKAENDRFESDISNEEGEDYEEEDMEEGKDEESGMNMKRDMDGNSFDVEVEIGIGNCQRVRRCQEGRQGNKNFCDWRKPLWVATS